MKIFKSFDVVRVQPGSVKFVAVKPDIGVSMVDENSQPLVLKVEEFAAIHGLCLRVEHSHLPYFHRSHFSL